MSEPKAIFGKLGLIWKVFAALFIFQAAVMAIYAYMSHSEFQKRLDNETEIIRDNAHVYFSSAVKNHANYIRDNIYILSGFENNELEAFVSFFQSQWLMLALEWDGESLGIYQNGKLLYQHGHAVTQSQAPFSNSLNQSVSQGKPNYYVICQVECSLVIFTPVLLSGEEVTVVIQTSLMSPILNFREFLNLKTLVISESIGGATISDLQFRGDSKVFRAMRQENNLLQFRAVQEASKRYSAEEMTMKGGEIALDGRNYLVDMLSLPYEKESISYFVILYDLTQKYEWDSAFNNRFILVSGLAMLTLAMFIIATLWNPTRRLNALKQYLPTLSREDQIQPLELTNKSILFYDEIDVLERTSSDLADRLIRLSSVVSKRELQLKELAMFDSLTGLANRENFNQALTRYIHKLSLSDDMIAVLFLDLDRFKHINDSLGHDIGDKVLCFTAQRLQSSVRKNDLVARIGGDEFTIILSHLHSESDVIKVIESILDNFTDPFHIGQERIDISLSIGVTLINDSAVSVSDVIKQADVAMYSAKRNNMSSYEFFSAQMQAEIFEHFNLVNDFSDALENKHFELYFQPIVWTSSGEIKGYEALIRWNHETRGVLAPDKFFPALRDTKLFRRLEDWIIYEGICSCNEINRLSEVDIAISINLTAEKFVSETLCQEIKYWLDTFNVDGRLIRIEIVEDTLLDDIELASCRCKALREMGIGVSIDDFGVGYSSLSYLRRLPADNVKIDRSFVRKFISDETDSKILRALIDFLKDMGKTVTVEGVESLEQVNKMMEFGCDYSQGYFYSKPAPLEVILPKIVQVSPGEAETVLSK